MKTIVSSDHIFQFKEIASDPVLTDLPVGTNAVFRNISTGDLEHWGNNEGVIELISGGADPGTSFTLSTLTDAATVTWAYDGNPAKVTIAASRTLAVNISGGGANYSTLEVVHTNAATVLTLPGNSDRVTWATGAGETTLLNMYHNGTSFIWGTYG